MEAAEPLFPIEGRTIGSIWSTRGNRMRWRATKINDIRLTPEAFFAELHAEFDFTIDVAALPHNALCDRYFTPEDNGLAQSWEGERCWMNPPYSTLAAWTEKAASEDALTVGLLPVRTDQGWFHDHVLARDAEVRFVRGRLRFKDGLTDADARLQGHRSNAPFASMVVVWGAK